MSRKITASDGVRDSCSQPQHELNTKSYDRIESSNINAAIKEYLEPNPQG